MCNNATSSNSHNRQMKIKEKILWINAKSQKSEAHRKLCKILRKREICEREVSWLIQELLHTMKLTKTLNSESQTSKSAPTKQFRVFWLLWNNLVRQPGIFRAWLWLVQWYKAGYILPADPSQSLLPKNFSTSYKKTIHVKNLQPISISTRDFLYDCGMQDES